jgi:RNA polymerase-binding transcription factor DksA
MPTQKKTPAKKNIKTSTNQTKSENKLSDTATSAKPTPKALQKAVVSREGAAANRKSAPIVFSLDDVEELMAAKKSVAASEETAPEKPAPTPKVQPTKKIVVDEQPVEKRVLGAASLADILGFNPNEKKASTELTESEIPKKWKKYYSLLVDLRSHVSDGINRHTSDSLQNSSIEEKSDQSTDTDTDHFDRDFALSLVSNEQDALNEIEAAILRIKEGTYGICEITGKPIPAARLTAVPFARYSVEGQAQHEKNQRRKNNRVTAGGIFGDVSDAPKIESSDDEE